MGRTSRHSRRPGSRPRLADVAKLCGVSAATVSRVLNEDAKFSIRPEVRQKIIDAARSVGYAPDLAARNLNRGSTHIIGVFGSPHMHIGEGINDAIFTGIADAFRARDYDVFFEMAGRNALPFWRFDGAILFQLPAEGVLTELGHRCVPYVCVNETVGSPTAAVLADDAAGTTLAMRHLADLGHTRIAYANAQRGYFEHYSITERHDTVAAFCKSKKLGLVPGHNEPFADAESFVRNAVLGHRATAVLCYDHRIAVGVLGAAQRLGLRVPRDLSLMCFNDEFPVATVHPPLTVIAVAGHAMGGAAANLLLEVLTTDDPAAEKRGVVRLPETLIVRASTAPPGAE